MTASELIEKIHNREIKSGDKIICHKCNEYFDFKVTTWFMGNWFSKVPPEEHESDDDFDREMILKLCDPSITYKVVDQNSVDERISNLQSQIDKLNNEIKEYYSKVVSARDRGNYLKEQLIELKKENGE